MKKMMFTLVLVSILAAFSCQVGLTSEAPVVEMVAKEGIPNDLPITEVLSSDEFDLLRFRRNSYDIEGSTWSSQTQGIMQVEGGFYPGSQSTQKYVHSFVIDNNRQVHRGWGNSPIFGGWDAVDVATGGGKTYMTNTSGEVLEYNETVNAFQSYGSIPGEVITKIDVEKNGNIWVVTQSGKIYGFNGTLYEMFDGLAGTALDVGCGDGEVYAVIRYPHGLNTTKLMKYNWSTGVFEDQNRLAKAVDVARDGTVYIVTTMYGIDGKRPGSTTWESTDTGFIKYYTIGCCQ